MKVCKKKKVDYISIIVTVIFILSILLIKAYPFSATNLSIHVNYNNVPDGTEVKIEFGIENDYILDNVSKSRVVNNMAIFNINPEFYNADSIKLYTGNIDDKFEIKSIDFFSGKFSKKDHKVGEITSKELKDKFIVNEIENIEYENNSIVISESNSSSYIEFDKTIIESYKDIIHNVNYVKVVAISFLFIIYFIFIINKFLKTKNKKIVLFNFTVVIIYIIFCISLFSMDDRLEPIKIQNSNASEEVFSLENTEIKQTFRVDLDEFKGINVFFNCIEWDEDADIIISLFDKETDEKKYSELIKTSDIVGHGYNDIVFDSTLPGKGKEYYLTVKAYGNNLDSFVNIVGSNNNSYDNGTLYINGEDTGKDLDIQITFKSFSYKKIVWVMVTILTLMCLVIFQYKLLRIPVKYVIVGIYVIAFIIISYQVNFYKERVGNTPDERAHISYIAYLEETNEIIPNFSEMKILRDIPNKSNYYRFDNTTNQLGHPPLYYHIMRLSGAVEVNDDEVFVDYDKLYLLSSFIALVAIAIILYIGYSRINKEIPSLHLLYTSIFLGIPMFTYNISGINNDTLTLIGVAIFMLGVLRHSENKRNVLTYLLIGFGMIMTLFGKITAGAILVIGSLIYVIWQCIKEKSAKGIFCKGFYISLPIYLIAILYFAKLYITQGTIQPMLKALDPETFYNSGFYVDFANRTFKSIGEYFVYFWESFFDTWTAIASHIALYKKTVWYSPERIVPILICFMPLILFKINKSYKYTKLLISLYIGIVVIAFMQFINGFSGFFYNSGYPGGYQSRYYLCVLIVLAFASIAVLDRLYNKGQYEYNDLELIQFNKGILLINTKKITDIIALIASVLLIYNNFIYFLLNFTTYK